MNTKGKIWKKILIGFFLILLITASGIGIFLYQLKNSGKFLKNTTLNGHDVAEQTPAEVLELLKKDFSVIQFELNEKEENDISCAVSDLGFFVDEERTLDVLNEALEMQNKNPLEMSVSLFYGLDFHVDIPTSLNEEVFTEKINAEALAVPRTPSKNAKLKQKKDGNYRVSKAVYGNEFADPDLQYEVRTQIGKALAEASDETSAFSTGKIVLDFPEAIYLTPTVLSTDKTLTWKRDIYNQFCQAEITYCYGSQTEILGWDTVKDWLVMEEGNEHIDADLAWAYVEDIAARYNTRYHDRKFTTTYGGTVTFPSGQNEYGYIVNQDGEFAQLMADLTSNSKVKREPVYYKTNSYDNPLYYKREGRDDLAGTYVEVNLSAQHLWFYKNGQLIIETDLVSGCVAKGHETTTGVFPLAYKKSPDVLVGSNANDGYRTQVEYWMPFYEGQGLHDATWRGSFGGNIYQTNGSHGCVNLPLSAAGVIYNNIEPGMAIILYK